MPHGPVAFRCKRCGHFITSEHAGENLLPHACSACSGGVSEVISADNKKRCDAIIAKLGKADTPDAERLSLAMKLSRLPREKVYHSDNWEVLADVTPERLKELELEDHHVVAHAPEVVTEPKSGRRIDVLMS